jgi:small subunit ribosomal protein S3Ae
MAKAKRKTPKIKKKHWFEIVAPKLFGEVVLGETHVEDKEGAIGKPIKLNIKTFSSKGGRNNISIGFEIKDFKDNKARCKVISYKLLPATVKRLSSRNKKKIKESFLVKTKDDKIARIKIILVTLNKTSNSTLTAIRNYLKQFVAKAFSDFNYEELIELTLDNKIPQQIKKSVSKIYPIRIAAVNSISIEKRRKKLGNVVKLDNKEKKKEENKTKKKTVEKKKTTKKKEDKK